MNSPFHIPARFILSEAKTNYEKALNHQDALSILGLDEPFLKQYKDNIGKAEVSYKY